MCIAGCVLLFVQETGPSLAPFFLLVSLHLSFALNQLHRGVALDITESCILYFSILLLGYSGARIILLHFLLGEFA